MEYYKFSPRYGYDIDEDDEEEDEDYDIYDSYDSYYPRILQRHHKEMLQQRRRRRQYPSPSIENEDEDDQPTHFNWRVPRYPVTESRHLQRRPVSYYYDEDFYSAPLDEEEEEEETEYDHDTAHFYPPSAWPVAPATDGLAKPTRPYLARSLSDSRQRFSRRRNHLSSGLRRSNSASSAPTRNDFSRKHVPFRTASQPGSPDETDEEETDNSNDGPRLAPQRRRSLHAMPPPPPMQDQLRRRRSMFEPSLAMPMPTPSGSGLVNGVMGPSGGSSTSPATPWLPPHALAPSFPHPIPASYIGSRPAPPPPPPPPFAHVPMPLAMMSRPGALQRPPMPIPMPLGFPWATGQHAPPPAPFPPPMMGGPLWDAAARMGASEHGEQTQTQTQAQAQAQQADAGEVNTVSVEESAGARETAAAETTVTPDLDNHNNTNPAQSLVQPPIQRRRSLFGGLFGGSGPAAAAAAAATGGMAAKRMVHDTFRQDPSTFVSVDAPQNPALQNGLARKLSRRAQQFKQLSTVWCYRPRHIPDDASQRVWVAFSIQNQYKLDKAAYTLRSQGAARNHQLSVTLDKEEKLPGTVFVMPASGVAYHFPSLFSSNREELEVACFPAHESNLVLRPVASPETPAISSPTSSASTRVASRIFGSMFG
ncbi:hypothetical protein EC973_007961 [Apophysomyces ossiformis]|uniref:Uncharacterized protein n=1 Tax=Apophysomyces ossiformis TaxID=679940 RepID=A0A8H7BXF8_9FUNG|nr:hypothetical protein EC973_007961 [Apophysomyces ossiformis]